MSETPWTVADLPKDLSGKVYIVTGTSAGLGTVQAIELASRGATVIGGNRSNDKAEKAFESLKNSRKANVAGSFKSHTLDLADNASVKAFAAKVIEEVAHVDGVLLNAGVMNTPTRKESSDGVEFQMACNVVGHHLLASLLLPKLKAAPGRAVVVSTASVLAKKATKEQFDDLNSEKGYVAERVYELTKVSAILWRDGLRKVLAGQDLSDKIHVQTSHPGVSRTSLFGNLGVVARIIFTPLSYLIASAPEDGAIPNLRAALDTDLKDGSFVGPTKSDHWKGPAGVYPDFNPDVSNSTDLQEKLWAFCNEKTGAQW